MISVSGALEPQALVAVQIINASPVPTVVVSEDKVLDPDQPVPTTDQIKPAVPEAVNSAVASPVQGGLYTPIEGVGGNGTGATESVVASPSPQEL